MLTRTLPKTRPARRVASEAPDFPGSCCARTMSWRVPASFIAGSVVTMPWSGSMCGVHRPVSFCVVQDYPWRVSRQTLSAASKKGLTLFDWNKPVALRLRLPDSLWSQIVTIALPAAPVVAAAAAAVGAEEGQTSSVENDEERTPERVRHPDLGGASECPAAWPRIAASRLHLLVTPGPRRNQGGEGERRPSPVAELFLYEVPFTRPTTGSDRLYRYLESVPLGQRQQAVREHGRPG